jgi:hypothetical protein
MIMLPPVYAFLFAALASGCSVYVALEMGLPTSELRLLERMLAFALVAVLGLGLRTRAVRESGSASLLAFPLALAACAAAGYEFYLEMSGQEAFPSGMLNAGSIALQNMILFGIILFFVILGVIHDVWYRIYTLAAAFAALLFGAAIIFGLAVTMGIVSLK